MNIIQIQEKDINYARLLSIFEKYLVEHLYYYNNGNLYIIHFDEFVKYRTCVTRALKKISFSYVDIDDCDLKQGGDVPICDSNGKVISEINYSKIDDAIKNKIRAKNKLNDSYMLEEYVGIVGYHKISLLCSKKERAFLEKSICGDKITSDYKEADYIICDNEIKSTILRLKGFNCEYTLDLYEKLIIFRDFLEWKSINELPVFYYAVPKEDDYSSFTEAELIRMQNKVSFEEMTENIDVYIRDFEGLFKGKFTKEYIKGLCNNPTLVEIDNQFFYLDYESNLVNIHNGVRETVDQPEACFGRIVFWGKCTVFGNTVEDKCTIPSMFQNRINKKIKNIQVVNRGVKGLNLRQLFLSIINSKPNSKDAYIILSDDLSKADIQYLNSKGVVSFDKIEMIRNNDEEIVYDKPFHVNEVGNRIICKFIYDNSINSFLKYYSMDRSIKKSWRSQWEDRAKNIILDEYRSVIDEIIINKGATKNGAIIMNANPMTKGHEYLVDYARKKVDYLLVLVVQEENGMFSFNDRLQMVKNVCLKYDNVVVLGGGYYCTKETFPAYFIRNAENIDVRVDESLFFDEFADIFNIKVRFLGEEPLNPVTNVLNDYAKKEAKKRDMECVIIPRLYIKNECVSAGKVRKAIANRDYKLIDSFVPDENKQFIRQLL